MSFLYVVFKLIIILIGSTPDDNRNINGVLLLESSRAPGRFIAVVSKNCRPSFSETKFDIANESLSSLKHLTKISFFKMLLLSFHFPIKKKKLCFWSTNENLIYYGNIIICVYFNEVIIYQQDLNFLDMLTYTILSTREWTVKMIFLSQKNLVFYLIP